nr:immunoglobulin heavy chain junction region [Macaca mulatta]
CVRKNVNFDSW